MSDEQANTKNLKWVPLESNPDVWNEIAKNAGVKPEMKYHEVYGFDPELLEMLPGKVEAMILLFPITPAYEDFRKKEEERLTKREQDISTNVVFFKQTISNACGMIALLHSVASHANSTLNPGVFKDIIEPAKNMSIDERVELLENNQDLANLHANAAEQGQTRAPDRDEPVELHFICFVEVNNHLYELDGREPFPINHKKCEHFVEDSVKIIKEFIARDPENDNFSCIALCREN